jgi:hypothetical protein
VQLYPERERAPGRQKLAHTGLPSPSLRKMGDATGHLRHSANFRTSGSAVELERCPLLWTMGDANRPIADVQRRDGARPAFPSVFNDHVPQMTELRQKQRRRKRFNLLSKRRQRGTLARQKAEAVQAPPPAQLTEEAKAKLPARLPVSSEYRRMNGNLDLANPNIGPISPIRAAAWNTAGCSSKGLPAQASQGGGGASKGLQALKLVFDQRPPGPESVVQTMWAGGNTSVLNDPSCRQ